jgi:hypothetical protein
MKLCSKYLRRFAPGWLNEGPPEVSVSTCSEFTIRDVDLVYLSSSAFAIEDQHFDPLPWRQLVGPMRFTLEETDILFHFTPVDTRVYVRYEELWKILQSVKILHDAALHQGFDIKPRLIEAMIEAYGITRAAQLVYEGGDWLKNEIARVEKSLL